MLICSALSQLTGGVKVLYKKPNTLEEIDYPKSEDGEREMQRTAGRDRVGGEDI